MHPLSLIAFAILVSVFPLSLQGRQELQEQQHLLVGRDVLVVVAGAKIRTQDATVWKSWPGEVHTVAMVRDDWLWIHDKGGWLWSKHVVPLDEAVERFSRELKQRSTPEGWHLPSLCVVSTRRPCRIFRRQS